MVLQTQGVWLIATWGRRDYGAGSEHTCIRLLARKLLPYR